MSIVLSSAFFTNRAIAQNKPLACQADAAAGLAWQNGRWVTDTFERQRYILVQAGKTFTRESVAKVFLHGIASQTTCVDLNPGVFCRDETGSALFFDQRALKGTIARMYGGVLEAVKRDTVTVEVFSCTPF